MPTTRAFFRYSRFDAIPAAVATTSALTASSAALLAERPAGTILARSQAVPPATNQRPTPTGWEVSTGFARVRLQQETAHDD